MKSNFKFFRGYVGTLDIIDGQTYGTTASFYDPSTLTNDERLIQNNRRLQIAEQFRNQGIMSQEQYNLNRDMFIEQERIRRLEMINHSRQTDEQIILFQATRVTTVNPTLWTKIKIFGTGVKLVLNATWRSDPIGVIVVTLLSSIVTFIGIMKLFGA
jgi:hypothetical protein